MSKIFTKVIVHTVNDLTFWNCYLIKNIFLNTLLSWFLTACHYSLGAFFPAKDTKAGAIGGCQTWMSFTLSVTECMSCLDSLCGQPQTWSHQDSQALCILDCYLPFGVAPPGFQPGLAAWKNSLPSIPPTFPFTVCKPWPSTQGMVLVALTAEYQECLKAGPFDVHYQCISAWLHCNYSTRMRCVDTFCWDLSLIYLYREDAWNVPVSLFFLNVVISLYLNDSAHNILNDVLKIMFVWSCWKLALQWF